MERIEARMTFKDAETAEYIWELPHDIALVGKTWKSGNVSVVFGEEVMPGTISRRAVRELFEVILCGPNTSLSGNDPKHTKVMLNQQASDHQGMGEER